MAEATSLFRKIRSNLTHFDCGSTHQSRSRPVAIRLGHSTNETWNRSEGHHQENTDFGNVLLRRLDFEHDIAVISQKEPPENILGIGRLQPVETIVENETSRGIKMKLQIRQILHDYVSRTGRSKDPKANHPQSGNAPKFSAFDSVVTLPFQATRRALGILSKDAPSDTWPGFKVKNQPLQNTTRSTLPIRNDDKIIDSASRIFRDQIVMDKYDLKSQIASRGTV